MKTLLLSLAVIIALISCNNKTEKKQQTKKSSKCHRCGRNGHYKSSCYAKKHIKGFYLS